MSANNRLSNRSFANASLSNTIFFVAQSAVFLVLTPVTLHVLGNESYGLWTIMLAILGFSNLAQFGIDATIVKYTAQYSVNDERNEKFSAAVTFCYIFVLLTSILFCLAIWLLRFWISQVLNVNPNLTKILPGVFGIIALGTIPGFLFSVSRGILLGLIRNNLANSLDTGSNIVLWIGAPVIGLLGGSVFHLAVWIAMVNVFRFGLCTYWAIQNTANYKLYFSFDNKIIREMLHFSFLSWVTSIGGTLFGSLDRLLVGIFLGPSVAGVYGIATSLAARLTGMISRVVQVLMPFSSAMEEVGHRHRTASVLRLSSRLVGCASMFFSGALVIWMNEILRLWISADFASIYGFSFQLIMICYGLYSLALPAQQIAQGMGWLAIPAAIYLAGGMATDLLIWGLAPRFGFQGAILANYSLISLLGINFYLAKRIGLSFKDVIQDFGLPFLAFAAIISISFMVIPLPAKLLISVAFAGTMAWLAFGQKRLNVLLRAIKAP
jgi:O-antigen/teichoic acid export membrane protein